MLNDAQTNQGKFLKLLVCDVLKEPEQNPANIHGIDTVIAVIVRIRGKIFQNYGTEQPTLTAC